VSVNDLEVVTEFALNKRRQLSPLLDPVALPLDGLVPLEVRRISPGAITNGSPAPEISDESRRQRQVLWDTESSCGCRLRPDRERCVARANSKAYAGVIHGYRLPYPAAHANPERQFWRGDCLALRCERARSSFGPRWHGPLGVLNVGWYRDRCPAVQRSRARVHIHGSHEFERERPCSCLAVPVSFQDRDELNSACDREAAGAESERRERTERLQQVVQGSLPELPTDPEQ